MSAHGILTCEQAERSRRRLKEERDRAVDAANAAYEYDSATRQENRELAEKVNHNKLIAEAAQAKARLAGRRELELTNAIRYVIDNSPGTPDSVKKYLRAALAPAVEEQR